MYVIFQTLINLDQREKQIKDKEELLERSERKLSDEYERKTIELREASRRVKEEYEHQLHLEKIRYSGLVLP